jgi:type VI protein secretion system component VasF
LLSEIQQLESIINRTFQQEQRLSDLREQLSRLENSQEGDPKKPNSTNYWLWILGAVVILLVVGIILYPLLKNKKSSKK